MANFVCMQRSARGTISSKKKKESCHEIDFKINRLLSALSNKMHTVMVIRQRFKDQLRSNQGFLNIKLACVIILAFLQLDLALFILIQQQIFELVFGIFFSISIHLFSILQLQFIVLKQRHLCYRIYMQKLRKEWFNDPRLSKWIPEINKLQIKCKFCQCILKSKLRTHITHGKASIHVKMSDPLSSNGQKTLQFY